MQTDRMLVCAACGYKIAAHVSLNGKVFHPMNLRVSGKHMDIGDALRARIDMRIKGAVDKYFDGGFSGHVTVEKSGSGFAADCVVSLDTGVTLQASGRAMDATAAFDMAADRIEKRLRRYKRRLKAHNSGNSGRGETHAAEDVTYRVMALPPEEEDEELAEDYAPAVVAETRMPLPTMSVATAVFELDTKDSPVFVFRNAANDQVNVVYRRPDGNIGWIDPELTSTRQGQ